MNNEEINRQYKVCTRPY
jgi:hypothetical protein